MVCYQKYNQRTICVTDGQDKVRRFRYLYSVETTWPLGYLSLDILAPKTSWPPKHLHPKTCHTAQDNFASENNSAPVEIECYNMNI